MKTLKSFIFTFLICQSVSVINAQLSTNELPFSFNNENASLLKQKNVVKSYEIELSKTLKQLDAEDSIADKNNLLPRIGYPIPVNFDMTNAGTWTTLENGDKLWQMEISSPGAFAINLTYDKFWLPDDAKLFIYSKDKTQYLGAFTSINNKGDSINLRGFVTDFIYSDKIIVEYYQPAKVTQTAIISIDQIVHAYKDINVSVASHFTEQSTGFGQSGSCEVGINCPEGSNWQEEKRAVALIIANGRYASTGSLINNTRGDMQPLLLTADHCIELGSQDGGEYIKYDAVTNPNLDQYLFYWDYELLGCKPVNPSEPAKRSTAGATVLANNSYTDFALLSLSENPKNLSNFDAYYLGWDRTSNPGSGGVCIHHPKVDVKKISTYNATPTTSGTYWVIQWAQTPNGFGITEGGSSGSPLLTLNGHRIIGQLRGVFSDLGCSFASDVRSIYGKFYLSWDYGDIPQRRLKDWLDPTNMGVQFLNGTGAYSPISIDGTLRQVSCPLFNNQPIAINHWGGAYNVCRNMELYMQFTSNKTNLTCSLWYGDGTYYLQYFSNGYYVLTGTPQSDIFELSITDGRTTEYIAFESQNYYSITYDNSSKLIQIKMNEDMVNTRANSLYNVSIFDQMGSMKKTVKMENNAVSISTVSFSNGIYFVHIMDNTGQKIGLRKISVSN